ncbi:MAG TPA: DUF4365 domain-containing protein [Puia sp.]|jgi:hypothetical protein|nr:DUF4365 domain-containing protein [Puia sp.]
MALDDLPQIDQSASNSATSVRKLMALLNDQTGFILRPEDPDLGCDYMVEVVAYSGATGSKFPLQLKSIDRVNLVGDGKFISYQVKTSRLGYMLKHTPTTGIFVFYDVSADKCYYDFSDLLYQRINDDRQSEEWTNQEFVNVRMSITNELTAEGIAGLKERLSSRFSEAAKMQAAYGSKYGLPIVNLLDGQFDPRNPSHLKRLLKEYGLFFLGQYDTSIIYNAISNLSHAEVNSDKDLLILAALSYCEVGCYADSDLFQRKARSKFDLTDQEKNMLDYVDLKNKLQLGLITMTSFRQGLETLKGDSDANNLILDINSLRYALANDVDDNEEYERTLKSIFDRIDSSSLPEKTKQLYNLWNAMNESLITSSIFSRSITLARTREVAGNDLPLAVKREKALAYLNAEKAFSDLINKIYMDATASNNVFVRATALQISATHLVQKLINLIALNIDTAGLEEIIRNRAGQALESFNLFAGLDLMKDAHFSLSLNVELLDAAKHLFHSNVDKDIETLVKTMSGIEREYMLPRNSRVILSLIEDKAEQKKLEGTRPPLSSLKTYTDAQLQTFARVMMETHDMPEDVYNNVMNALRAYRLFYIRCSHPNIRPNEKPHDQTYRQPIVFYLKNTITDIVSLESSDIEYLLASWGY